MSSLVFASPKLATIQVSQVLQYFSKTSAKILNFSNYLTLENEEITSIYRNKSLGRPKLGFTT